MKDHLMPLEDANREVEEKVVIGELSRTEADKMIRENCDLYERLQRVEGKVRDQR